MLFEMNVHAPRLSASRAVSSESTAERTAILTDGIRSRSSRMQVKPVHPRHPQIEHNQVRLRLQDDR